MLKFLIRISEKITLNIKRKLNIISPISYTEAKIEKRIKKTTLLRGRILLFFILAFVMLIIFRMFQIYFMESDKNIKKALIGKDAVDKTLEYRRGDIVDRNGVVLAKSEISYSIILDAIQLRTEIEQNKKNRISDPNLFDLEEETYKFLKERYAISNRELRKAYDLEISRNGRYFVLKKGISNSDIQRLKEEQEKKDSKISQNGIWIEHKYRRVYPFKDLASNLIGYINDNGDPVIGLELEYDDYLKGINGRDFRYMDSSYGFLRKRIEPQNGDKIISTIDIGIQQIITDEIKKFGEIRDYKAMSILVMNPSKGEVLGMASTPFFDLNNPLKDLKVKEVEKNKVVDGKNKKVKVPWKQLTDDEKSKIIEKRRSNYTVSNAFEPGSTFKPITYSMGLELDRFKPDTKFYCDGGEKIDNYYIACNEIKGHGTLSAAKAIQVSCNDALMQMGKKIGVNNFVDYQNAFNFGRLTGIDLPNEIGNPNMLYNKQNMKFIDLATNSFGQNFLVNMMQLASADGAIGNNGNYYTPRVCIEIQDENSHTVKKIEPELKRQVISKDVAMDTKRAMRLVVDETTIKKEFDKIDGFEHQFFGKTGTAEKLPRSEGKYITSFIVMTPFDNPELLIYVVIDEGSVYDTYNAEVISARLMKELIPYLGINVR